MKTFTLSSEGVLARYDYLSRLSPDRWAWEYARRNPDLRRDAEARSDDDVSEMKAPCADIRLLKPRNPQRLAHRWGLMFMPDPDLNGFEADAVWNKHVFPDQVEVNCSPRAPGESCDIWDSTVPICQITHITDLQAREFLLIRGKGCVVQVRCTGLSLLGMEPVRMNLTISDLDAFERKVKAQKAALALPVLMIAMYYALRYAQNVAKLFTVPILFLAFLTLVCIVLRSTEVGFALQSVFFTRGIAISALTLVQYYDLFSTYGYTWWSNITGLSLILPAPPAFANDPSWPALGQIVGDHYYGAGTNLNANANPYSGEGLAAGGLVGLLVIGVIMAAFLRVYDLCVAGWDRLFVLLIAVPVGFALSNAHLSTVMVSFGLAAWLLIFAFYKPGRGGWL